MKLNFKGAYPNYQVLRVICDNPLIYEEKIGEIRPIISELTISELQSLPLTSLSSTLSLVYFSFTRDYIIYELPIDEQEQITNFITACHNTNTNQITLEFID